MTSLNPSQQQIVEHMEGPALVIAGAGSGKTRVITHRVAHLIEKGIPPSSIMMVTFTNKSAEEMLRRAEGLIAKREQINQIVSGTFHSLANRFLRRYAPLVGHEHNFSILDEEDSRDVVRAAIAECISKSERKFPTAAVVRNLFSLAFNKNVPIAQQVEKESPWLMDFLGELEALHTAYGKKKRENNAMDFDDLLANWHLLLTTKPDLELAGRIRFIMVDEYQDTNSVQAEIVELLARQHRNLMVVGDDAQSIYGWRGANFANILRFPDRFGGEVYRLEENYRSTPNILALANCSINNNTAQFVKNLYSVKPEMEIPRVVHVYDQQQEADLVTDQILYYADQDIPLRHMGVLYRNHMQSAVLQLRLTERGIPFMVRSGIKFFEQAHIKDVVAFLKVVFNPLDEIAWLRILKMLPGIGNTTAQRIFRIFREQQAVRLSPDNEALTKAVPAKAREDWLRLAETLKALIREGVTPTEMIDTVRQGFYHDRLYSSFDNAGEREAELKYLGEFAQKYRSLERFLGQLALVGSTVVRDYDEETQGDEDYLTLTTIHQAKGLEWDVVFLLGLAEGQFPHARCLEPPERLEEERRLFYVGVTRCKRYLEIYVPLVTFHNGMSEICRASRFVEELPEHVVEVTKAVGLENLQSRVSRRRELSVDF
ncbi:MAG: ATP-dependent helicase [SAR324 cluster bacterium]|nr:ATP-dependent helicase [SAR324 cluster bacterium]